MRKKWNNLTLHTNQLEKEQKLQLMERNCDYQNRNKWKMKETIAKTNKTKTKSWFLEKINEIEQTMWQTHKNWERLKSIKLEMKKEKLQ